MYVRSSMAHARILDIDTSAAAPPGVIKVLTAADIAHLPKLPSPFPGVVPDPYLRPMLATDLVRFVGEPVAAVIAENAYLATDAAEQVVVSYEPLTVGGRSRRVGDRQVAVLRRHRDQHVDADSRVHEGQLRRL